MSQCRWVLDKCCFSLSRCPWTTYLAFIFSSAVPTFLITMTERPPNTLALVGTEMPFTIWKQSLAIKPAISCFISSAPEGDLHLGSDVWSNSVRWLITISRDWWFEMNLPSSLSWCRIPDGIAEVMLKGLTLFPSFIQTSFFSIISTGNSPSHLWLSSLYTRTGSPISKWNFVWGGRLDCKAVLIRFSAWIEAIYLWALTNTSILSVWAGSSPLRAGTAGGIPNNSIDGESPEGPAVSLIALIKWRRMNSSSTDEYSVLSFKNIRLRGRW